MSYNIEWLLGEMAYKLAGASVRGVTLIRDPQTGAIVFTANDLEMKSDHGLKPVYFVRGGMDEFLAAYKLVMGREAAPRGVISLLGGI